MITWQTKEGATMPRLLAPKTERPEAQRVPDVDFFPWYIPCHNHSDPDAVCWVLCFPLPATARAWRRAGVRFLVLCGAIALLGLANGLIEKGVK